MTNLGFLKAPSVGLLASVPSSGFEELATEGSPPGTQKWWQVLFHLHQQARLVTFFFSPEISSFELLGRGVISNVNSFPG